MKDTTKEYRLIVSRLGTTGEGWVETDRHSFKAKSQREALKIAKGYETNPNPIWKMELECGLKFVGVRHEYDKEFTLWK